MLQIRKFQILFEDQHLGNSNGRNFEEKLMHLEYLHIEIPQLATKQTLKRR